MALSTTAFVRNLSRLEMGLAIVVIAVIVALFMRRVDTVERAAEEAWLTTRIQYIQSHLTTVRLTELTDPKAHWTRDADKVIAALGYEDIHWFERASAVDWDQVPVGEWVWLREPRLLEYRAAEPGIAGASGEPPRVRFQLRRSGADTIEGGAPSAAGGWRLDRLPDSP